MASWRRKSAKTDIKHFINQEEPEMKAKLTTQNSEARNLGSEKETVREVLG